MIKENQNAKNLKKKKTEKIRNPRKFTEISDCWGIEKSENLDNLNRNSECRQIQEEEKIDLNAESPQNGLKIRNAVKFLK